MVMVPPDLELVIVPKLESCPCEPLPLIVITMLLVEARVSAVPVRTPTLVTPPLLVVVLVVNNVPLEPAFKFIVVGLDPSLLNTKS